jgi:hypothetical protein
VGPLFTFLHFEQKTFSRCPPCKNVDNKKKVFLGQLTSIAEVITIWVMHYIGVTKFFPQCGLNWYQKTQNFA